jgi:hypothetical protein
MSPAGRAGELHGFRGIDHLLELSGICDRRTEAAKQPAGRTDVLLT